MLYLFTLDFDGLLSCYLFVCFVVLLLCVFNCYTIVIICCCYLVCCWVLRLSGFMVCALFWILLLDFLSVLVGLYCGLFVSLDVLILILLFIVVWGCVCLVVCFVY